jgi:hypothetical protein
MKCQLLWSTHEIGFDLGCGGTGESPIVRCLRAVTDIFQLKIHRDEAQLHLLRAS